MREKEVEQKLVKAVKLAGGFCIKFTSPGFDGVPDRLVLLPKGRIASSEVYNEYRIFCTQVGEFTRSTTDFYTALETVGFERYRDRKGRYIKGLRLKTDFMEEE